MLQLLILGVNDGSVPLISVVKGLGEYLTSTEDETRLKGELVHVAKLIKRSDLSLQSD